jgi:uncharacterized protein YhaN
MIIKDLQIDGFGVWSDLELPQLDAGLTLLYGENETGKTTLLEFVRSVLYGYDDERRQKYLPPVRGGLGGGTLGVSTHAGQFRIRRRAEGDGHQGRLDLTSYNGTAQDLRQMKKILADLDESTFKNVFALGLSEIQELGTLSGGGAAEFLYDLAVGSGGISLTEVQRELDGARTRLFSGERSAHVSKLLDERNKLLADIEQLRALGRNYTLLADERQRLADDVERCELESTELHASADIIEAAVHVYERWHTRSGVAERLAGLGELVPIPEEAWTKLNAWRERYKEIRPTLDKLKAERNTFRKQMRDLPVNKILWRQGPRIEVLAAQLTWIDQLETEIRKLEAEIKPAAPTTGRRETLSGELVKLGLTPSSAEKLSDKRLLRNLFNVHRERRDADKRLEQAAEAEARVRDRYEPTPTVVETTKPIAPARRETAALETQGQLVANLRKRVQADQKIEQLTGHREESQRRIRELLSVNKVPADLVFNLNTGFVVGALLFFTGIFATKANLLLIPNTALWIIGGFMAAMCGFSKIMRDLAQNEQLEGLRNQARSIETELRDLEAERDELDAKIPPGAGPILTRLQYAERDLAELEERVGDAHAQAAATTRRETVVVRDESREEYESIRVEFRTAQELADKANRRWQHDLERAGFPAQITWEQIRAAAKTRSKTDAEKRRVEKRNKYVERRRGELALIADRVTQAFTEAQLEPQGDRVSDQLRHLYAEWRNNEDLIERRKELRGELRGVDRRLHAARKELTTLVKRRKHLLKSLGTSTEKMLRRRRDRLKLQAELREQHAVLSREITLSLGSRGTEDDLRARMENFELPQLEQRWSELTERLTAVEARLKELYEEQGRLEQKLETAAADASLPRKLYDLKRIECAVGDALKRWQTLTVAARLVEQVRKKYEAERQPETLREASRYFERLTEGKYKRVWTPLEAGVLFVDTAGGERLSVDVLSRGTREQLFLALRLALVDLYARRGKVMPLVLDDVLVNFDTRRTRIAAELLCDFATEQRQLLLFTCHEHIVRLFRTLRAEIRLLPGQHVSDEDTPVRTVEKIVEKVVEKVVKVKEPVYLPAPVVEMPAMPWLNGAGVFHEVAKPKPKPVPPPKMELPPPPVVVKEPEYEDVVEEVVVEAPPETIVRTKRVGYPVVPLWSPATPFAEANWQESIEDDPRDASQLKTLGNLPTTSLGNGGNGNGNHGNGGRANRNGGIKNRVPRPTLPRPTWAEDEFGDEELPETE